MPVHGRGRGTERRRASQRTETQSQSQLQTQSQDFASLSTASLPPHYAVTLAKAGPPPDGNELNEAYIRGAEIISDVGKVDESLTSALVALPSRRGLWKDNCLGAREADEDKPRSLMWRTAGLAYPCTCNLPIWPQVYRFADEPRAATKLAPLDTHPEPHLIPMLGDDIWPWSTTDFEETDLDSAMLDLAEFVPSWQDAPLLRPRGAVAAGRRDAKGKGKARADAYTSTQQRPALLSQPSPGPLQPPAPPSSFPDPTTPPPEPQDWVEDVRHRRAWWRDTIEADGSFGAFWSSFPRTTYPSLPFPKQKRRRETGDAFKPARNLANLPHPFHPDISHYCANAGNRVFWIIPIHGPVVIPRLNDPVTQDNARPWPSRAEYYADSTPPHPAAAEKRPAVIRWTPDLLRAFVQGYFETVYKNPERPYGALHLALSGPKPDPYLALAPPPPLERHAHLPRGAENISGSPPPVRPESGDHLRIYCDAARAMSLRTWLHWWTVGDGDAKRRPFERARFTLVGPRGEALVVA